MAKIFFNGWELWQKMTFVLAVAIAVVFCIAYGKLVWVNRILKKQEVIDEEKRTRIQALRQSGHIVESSKTDVPFGIRAIQSGIQVDGIWISNTSTPVPSELRFGKSSASPTESTSGGTSSNRNSVVKEAKLASRASTKLSPPKDGDTTTPFLEQTDDAINNRQSYQPRKASHLRYDGYGAFDPETLNRLESKTSMPGTQTHQTRDAHQRHFEAEIALAADNELNSATSSDSGNTLSDKGKRVVSSSKSKPMSAIPTSTYFPVPTETPRFELSDPFASPAGESSLSRASSAQQTRRSSWIDYSQAGPYQDARSPFVPGALHQNRDSRRVNSGFEVLPAGTFALKLDQMGEGLERGEAADEDSGDKRTSTRLQRKRKDPAIYERPPSSKKAP